MLLGLLVVGYVPWSRDEAPADLVMAQVARAPTVNFGFVPEDRVSGDADERRSLAHLAAIALLVEARRNLNELADRRESGLWTVSASKK